MRKLLICLLFVSCTVDPIEDAYVPEPLAISLDKGIKLENYIVTDQVLVNAKVDRSGQYSIKIKDISGSVVSKEVIDLKIGSNIHKVYVKVLPVSSYSVELFSESGELIGTEVFSIKN